MKNLFSRRRYEVLALATFGFFALLHLTTSAPIIRNVNDGGVLHRFVQNIEGRVSTVFFRTRGEIAAHPDVVVMELDERGAQRFGLWPWPRDIVAKSIDALLDADAKVIGLDMAFTDETSVDARERAWLVAFRSTSTVPAELQGIAKELEDRALVSPDAALEAVFRKGGPRIVQGVIPFEPRDVASIAEGVRARYAVAVMPEVITSIPGSVKGSTRPINLEAIPARAHSGVQAPLQRFSNLGSRYGHFGADPDLDGTIRRTPVLVKLKEPPGLFPSLGLQVAARQLDAAIVPVIEDDELMGVQLGKTRVPMQTDAPYTLINYPGSSSAFSRISVVDVLDGTVPREKVAGKAVLVGVTITGSMGDQRNTPFNEVESGVITHASMVSNILRADFLDRPWWLRFVELGVMLSLGLVLTVVTARIRSFVSKMLVMVAVIGGFTLATYFLFTAGLKVSCVMPTVHLTVTAFGTIFLGYLSVDREKLKMRSTFSRYLGEDVMDVALENPERLNRGEKREMTVLFSDIRGFTSLSEHMSPEKLADFINQYLSPMTQIVFDEKGTLDKYIGDAVMAFWNAPLDQHDHALRACRAAVHMLERLEELKAQWRANGLPGLEIGIGINTGQMVVGNMGSDVRVDYTVLGDSVNLGSRLEGTNKEYETRIIISEWTRGAVKEGIVTRRLGAVRVKGKKVPVGIFELRGLGTPSEADGKAITAFEAGLTAMTERRFSDATRFFTEVLGLWPNDGPARNYLEELETFTLNPPPADWDGVVSLKTK
ncbi:MAG: adenylate/guanylate cyclase domain-containing protein [Archangium sp.]|nr:adenylate/guanylate cyclase domain-containing protein [Archangium sp.]MDP3569056.1 adenylate/guanylate cyclase domain-containing protein [Archangium sp.]